MTKHHLRFRNFHPRIVGAADNLFHARPWRLDEREQVECGQAFLDALGATYDVPVPILAVDPYVSGSQYAPQIVELDSFDNVVATSPARIIMRSFSILTLFTAARSHALVSGVEPIGQDDSFAWGCSLFYRVKPRMFRARVREGRVVGMYARDTFSSESWAVLESAGVTDGVFLACTPEEAKEVLRRHRAGETVAVDLVPGVDYEESTPADPDWANEDGSVNHEAIAAEFSDGLDDLSITALRQLSRGVFSGGYSMRKPELIATLRAHNVRS